MPGEGIFYKPSPGHASPGGRRTRLGESAWDLGPAAPKSRIAMRSFVLAIIIFSLISSISSTFDEDDEDYELLSRILQRQQPKPQAHKSQYRKDSVDQQSLETRAGDEYINFIPHLWLRT